MIGIAGTENDFLLSLPVLKTYMDQFKEVRNNFNCCGESPLPFREG